MNGETIAFWVLSLGLVVSSIAVVFSKRLLRSAIFLALSLLLTAFFYISFGAELLAGIQILLYTGGVITLIVFVILLTEGIEMKKLEETHRGIVPALLASSLFFFMLVYYTWTSPKVRSLAASTPSSKFNVSKFLSESLFQEWVLPFEVLSLLLLAAIVGALVLARRERKEGET
ncbi:MAG: NADH-quinone oxidoreductase subunit J [Deltaproteobacteria bacterium]|nr:NADH-quinone oxidoreductase subunit J [Deltaproteobacteria bacterium]